jgi:hypothetical protein
MCPNAVLQAKEVGSDAVKKLDDFNSEIKMRKSSSKIQMLGSVNTMSVLESTHSRECFPNKTFLKFAFFCRRQL